MVEVVPTITEHDSMAYQAALTKVSFAPRLHVDIVDGQFASPATINLAQVHVPEGIRLDLHLMVDHPERQVETAISLNPHLVIVHAESPGDRAAMFAELRRLGIKVGLALLQQTPLSDVTDLTELDHLLIFSGHLGAQGGQFDPAMIAKIKQARVLAPNLEIAADGGINASNAVAVSAAGARVLNCGSYFQQAPSAKLAYSKLMKLVEAK